MLNNPNSFQFFPIILQNDRKTNPKRIIHLHAKNFTVPIELIDLRTTSHVSLPILRASFKPWMEADNPGNAIRAFTTGWDARKWTEGGHAPAIRKEKSDKVERERAKEWRKRGAKREFPPLQADPMRNQFA